MLGLGLALWLFVNEMGSEIELAIETKKSFFGPAPDTACTLRRALVTAAKSTLSFEPRRVSVGAEI